MSAISSVAERLAYWSLLLLALTLPFELEAPWLALGPVALTNVELLLAATLVSAALALPAGKERLRSVRRSWALLAAFFVACLLLTALRAPEFQSNALKAGLRTIAGLLLVPALLIAIDSEHRRRTLIYALLVGGLTAAIIGIVESLAGFDFVWLRPWRAIPTVAGPFLRLAGPFDYANQAAMFIEATSPFLVAIAYDARRSRRYYVVAGASLAFLIYVQAAILTFSRAGLGALILSTLIVAGVLLTRRTANRRFAAPWVLAALLVLTLAAANWGLSPSFRLRLRSDVDTEWYKAVIEVPARLTMRADETIVIPVEVTNLGTLTWHSSGTNRFNLGMRWQQAEGTRELVYQPRWPLAETVAPNESIVLQVPVRAPTRGGPYRLIWDMVHENVTWFGAKTKVEPSTEVTVVGDVAQLPPSLSGQLPRATRAPLQFEAPIPGRRVLWTIALNLIAGNPLSGIGLDNYRLVYGRSLPPEQLPGGNWNTSVHTNNWYLEMLVSLGILGSLPFFIWLALLGIDLWKRLRLPAVTVWQAATATGLLAFFIHGLLDYFLLFNATALLFWLLVGLWLHVGDDQDRL